MSCCPEVEMLLLDPSICRTGALQCAHQMAKALQGRVRCTLVLPEGATPPEVDLSPFYALEHLNLRNPGRSPFSLVCWLWALFVSTVRLRLLLRRRRITHLVLNDWYLLHGIICRLLCYHGVVITWVRLDPSRIGRRPAAVLFHLIAATSSRLVVVSRYVQRRLPPGVTSKLLYDCLPQPALPTIAPQGQRLVYVGNYTRGKGHDVAIEAFARIASSFPKSTLEFYGSTMGRIGNFLWRAGLKARAETLGLADRIHFNDFVDDPRHVLLGATVALNCSEAESFSLTVLEACAAGLPVIATDCGGPAEIIKHGITGLLVPVGSVDRIAEAIHQLLIDPARAQSMGAAAAAHVRQQFDPAVYRQQLIGLLTSP